uniref:Exostosin GT47 domain-containing protein n=1 Tax=Haptolina ericina TaxID=156174 RepID=A0A7S3BN46_9EUKA
MMKAIAAGAASENQSLTVGELEHDIGGGEWCFAPHKDIVLPPFYDDSRAGAPPVTTRPSKLSLVLAGGVWGPKNIGPQAPTYYAQGMRQRLYMQFGGARGDQHGIRIVNTSIRNERAFLGSSKLCGAPSGDGYGMRLSTSVLANCVPLLLQPSVVQPFEELLDYPTFSRRLRSPADIATIPQLIDGLADADLHAMRLRLSRVRSAFLWRGENALAYNYTTLALCWRAVELRGSLRSGHNSSYCEGMAALLPSARARPQLPTWMSPQTRQAARHLKERRRAAAVPGVVPSIGQRSHGLHKVVSSQCANERTCGV